MKYIVTGKAIMYFVDAEQREVQVNEIVEVSDIKDAQRAAGLKASRALQLDCSAITFPQGANIEQYKEEKVFVEKVKSEAERMAELGVPRLF